MKEGTYVFLALFVFWMSLTSQTSPTGVITETDNFCDVVADGFSRNLNHTTSWEVSLTTASITFDTVCPVNNPIQIKCMPLPSSIQYHFVCQTTYCMNIDLRGVPESSSISFDGCKFYGGGIDIKESFNSDVVIRNCIFNKSSSRNVGISTVKSVVIENSTFRDSLIPTKAGGGGCLMIVD
eukprot:PhF_6_TR34220/c0_g1_i6/m.50199